MENVRILEVEKLASKPKPGRMEQLKAPDKEFVKHEGWKSPKPKVLPKPLKIYNTEGSRARPPIVHFGVN